MPKKIATVALVGCFTASQATDPKAAFDEFVSKYNRQYDSQEEREKRFNIFSQTLAKIEAYNAKGYEWSAGVNKFADVSEEEFLSTHFGYKEGSGLKESMGDAEFLGTHRYSGAALPESVDWVSKGAVTDPKNQGQCGSCWAFSSTGALEGAWQIATGKLVSLSEQQLVDCASNDGCGGGDMGAAFKYFEDKDVCTEDSYSYTAKDGTCTESKCTAGIPKGGVTGYKNVQVHDTNALMEAVAQQPVSVAIEADQSVFQVYKGGVISSGCGAQLDHGVLVVGYGTDNGVDYWKVKNSWGGSWGEEGYVRIKRGLPADGECGIKDEPVYPVVKQQSSAVEKAFGDFVRKYQKTYTSQEKAERFNIFAQNFAEIEAENKKGNSYTLGVTAFADLKVEEFVDHHSGTIASANPLKGLTYLGAHKYTGAALPDSVDWVAKGAVTDPKNQGQCGSCWAFSSTGSLEGAWQIATGKLVSLSEQQLVDCAKNGNQGCKGGSMDLAFQYLEGQNVCTEDSYAYTAADGTCKSNCTTGIPKGGVTGFKDVSPQDTDALKEAVAQQPVSVAIEADQKVFQLYKGGVVSSGCGAALDHGVLIVGYGTDGGKDYWKVKNSWGASWGEEGYVRIARGIPKDGECGIKDRPVYPEVKASETTIVV